MCFVLYTNMALDLNENNTLYKYLYPIQCFICCPAFHCIDQSVKQSTGGYLGYFHFRNSKIASLNIPAHHQNTMSNFFPQDTFPEVYVLGHTLLSFQHPPKTRKEVTRPGCSLTSKNKHKLKIRGCWKWERRLLLSLPELSVLPEFLSQSFPNICKYF